MDSVNRRNFIKAAALLAIPLAGVSKLFGSSSTAATVASPANGHFLNDDDMIIQTDGEGGLIFASPEKGWVMTSLETKLYSAISGRAYVPQLWFQYKTRDLDQRKTFDFADPKTQRGISILTLDDTICMGTSQSLGFRRVCSPQLKDIRPEWKMGWATCHVSRGAIEKDLTATAEYVRKFLGCE